MTLKHLTNLADPTFLGDGQWTVPSRTVPNKSYVVTHRTGGWLCVCLGFKWTHWCNHCTRLKAYLATVESTEEQMAALDQARAEQIVREFLV